MPAGTVMGHVHLHGGAVGQAAASYPKTLGLDRTVWHYPGALFLSAGGYHHHLGTNTWAVNGALPPTGDDTRLIEWTIELPDASLVAAAFSLATAGHPVDRDDADLVTRDP